MMENIVSNIICSQFDVTLGRNAGAKTCSDPDYAMQVQFNLSPNHKVEEGYRHLTILIFGGGCNYIGVYAKLNWNVINKKSVIDDDHVSGEYTKGETPWVLICYHDSCWRDALYDLIWKHRERISTIDSLFNGRTGWYKQVELSDSEKEELYRIRRNTPGYGGEGKRVRLEELEFQFKEVADVH